MNALKSIQLMKKYNKCPKCGNDKVGGGEGTVNIKDDVFSRTCKCGWSVEVDQNDTPLLNLKVAVWATMGPRRIYELHDKENRFYGYVSVNELQKMGYVKRINHCKKAEEFFNTVEGLKWVNENRFFNAL
ncbi:hypothetical protein D3C75_859260 [compost metagenome]